MSSAKLISDELGLSRWQSMWTSRTDNLEISHLKLRATRPGKPWDSDRNIEWNLRTLLLLARAGVLQLQELPAPDLARLPSEDDEDYQTRREKAWAEAAATCAIRLLDSAPNTEKRWEDRVGKYREQSNQAAARNWQRMEAVLHGKRSLPDVLREIYRVPEAGIHNVTLHPTEGEVPTPPNDLCRGISEVLKNATRTAIDGLLILTYRTSGIKLYDLLRGQISLLKSLVTHGVREFATPAKWLERSYWDEHRNPLPDLCRQSIEGFMVVRNLTEPDTWSRQPDVPRVSLLMPDSALAPESLYSLHRPLHLLVIPEECADPAHPSRRIGDVRPNVMPLEDFARLLKL